jgi:hypothetical protein
MITKGYVIKKSTESPNKYSVRIPIFESTGIGLNTNGLNSSIYDCTLSHNPGTYEALIPGDCVFISFEDNNYAKPIILGKLFVNVEEESSGYQYNTDLKVTHKATLPIDTTIGNVPFENVLNYFNSIDESIDRLSIQTTSSLAANLILYPTTASADVSGYFKMVTSIDDPSYNTTAVDIPTGIINTNNQLLASLVSEPGVIIGNPGVINITTIGNIKRTVGNNNQYAAFYFTISKRSISGTETLLTTSNETPDVIIPNIYEEFSATALLNNGEFLNTDRIVIKYYASLTGNTGSNYDFQFGGTNPVRTLFPVPVSSIPSPKASNIITNTSNFNGILSSSDNTVQKALDKLDDHTHQENDIPTLDIIYNEQNDKLVFYVKNDFTSEQYTTFLSKNPKVKLYRYVEHRNFNGGAAYDKSSKAWRHPEHPRLTNFVGLGLTTWESSYVSTNSPDTLRSKTGMSQTNYDAFKALIPKKVVNTEFSNFSLANGNAVATMSLGEELTAMCIPKLDNGGATLTTAQLKSVLTGTVVGTTKLTNVLVQGGRARRENPKTGPIKASRVYFRFSIEFGSKEYWFPYAVRINFPITKYSAVVGGGLYKEVSSNVLKVRGYVINLI